MPISSRKEGDYVTDFSAASRPISTDLAALQAQIVSLQGSSCRAPR